MDLMLDGSTNYETFADVLKIGRACDEENFFWLEDPFNDGGLSHFAPRKLRQFIKTPLLQGEFSHGLEQRMNYLLADATDFIRGDVIQDGITATMKLAHAAEALGVDIEIHVGGPETRHCIAAIRNTNYFEWGLLNPKIKRGSNPSAQCKEVHKEGYLDTTLDGIGKDGCIPVPEGPGLGVVYDWDFINTNCKALKVFK
jgi:L-alanine-DL-glutamate epimerase-like enolase superfamily enzyme